MSQVVQQEAITRLLVEKGIFTKEEFLEMVVKQSEFPLLIWIEFYLDLAE